MTGRVVADVDAAMAGIEPGSTVLIGGFGSAGQPVELIDALVRQGADVLGLTPVLSTGLDLGEGANALAVLPALRTAIGLASALPVHPALLAEQTVPSDDEDV